MSAPIALGTINACAGQSGSFGLVIESAPGVPYPLNGCVVTCQVRAAAPPATPLATLTVAIPSPATGEIQISWSASDIASLTATGNKFTQSTNYAMDIEFAFADDPTHPSVRYWGTFAVFPGGNVEESP